MPHHYKRTHSHRQTHSHTDSFAHRQTDRHTQKHKHKHTHTHTHTQTHTITHTLSLTHTHTRARARTHGQTCIKSVNMFGWGIFGAVWKGRGGGQELCAEVIRAPGWGIWNPLFDQSFCFKHISLFCAPIGAFFRWYPPFPCYTKDFTYRNEVNFEPLYLNDESRFWKLKTCF